MPRQSETRPPRRASSLLLAASLACLLAALAPAASPAAVTTFGSPLSVAATLNTSQDLAYQGTNTAVPPSPEAPNGNFHTPHYGADTALWNIGLAKGVSSAPATGQALKVSLEGCAQAASGGPAPLTQIHFQDLTPLPGGGAKVNLTSQGFEIPVCGDHGASGSTVTSYDPINLCVSKGDFVGFNDDGGYVENVYRSGVPYQVLGSVRGSTADSFIKNDGTGDGALMSSSELAANDGFAFNHDVEVMQQVTLATGADATHICAGGTKGRPPVLAPIRVSPQTDGVNAHRIVAVAVFCRVTPVCNGVLVLKAPGSGLSYGRVGFTLPGERTEHVPIRVNSQMMGVIRTDGGAAATLSAFVAGKTVNQRIAVRIF